MPRLDFRRAIRVVLGGARPTRRGLAFLVLGSVGILAGFTTGMPILLYVGCFVLALPVVAFTFVRTRESTMSVTRRFSFAVVEAGSTTAVTLRVDNAARRVTSPVRWRDSLPWRPWVTDSGWLPRLSVKTGLTSDRSAAQLSYSLTPTERGVFEVGPLVVEATDPFDLAWGAWNVGSVTPLVVTPRVVQLATSALVAQSGDGEARVVQRRSAGDDDDSMTREYRRGDAMRRVHWKASARHGSLMVRQEEQHSYPEARIIVDTRLEGYPDASRASVTPAMSAVGASRSQSARFEWVVTMLASAVVQLRREGFLIHIIETAQSQLTDAATVHRRSSAEQELLTRLASFAPIESSAAWEGEPSTRSSTRGPVIALMANPEPVTVDFLVRQSTNNVLAVAFVVEPTSGFGDRERFGSAKRPPLADELRTAGWKVISVKSFDDVAEAWNLFVAQSRVASDGS
ncbi:uncharacterized protein (DUF58 family) [Rhodoglobus vestalii]|uniref:Uncharacterized protein (DUF58 family) n=1 Tax=Rhodoglobus vestalii TaxID=193384 RepID=A0A8H2PZ17_9MICO|nr:DUF58 domain-containing protein [Rhodoglobus vestalii]TQO20874.1 uncharacterized protein (DUF58 family) [Rhodoglobus vestalii]